VRPLLLTPASYSQIESSLVRQSLPTQQPSATVESMHHLFRVPTGTESPDYWRVKNQALKIPEIGHWSCKNCDI